MPAGKCCDTTSTDSASATPASVLSERRGALTTRRMMMRVSGSSWPSQEVPPRCPPPPKCGGDGGASAAAGVSRTACATADRAPASAAASPTPKASSQVCARNAARLLQQPAQGGQLGVAAGAHPQVGHLHHFQIELHAPPLRHFHPHHVACLGMQLAGQPARGHQPVAAQGHGFGAGLHQPLQPWLGGHAHQRVLHAAAIEVVADGHRPERLHRLHAGQAGQRVQGRGATGFGEGDGGILRWLFMRSGVLRQENRKQGVQGCLAASSDVVQALKEGQVEGEFFLGNPPVWAQPGAQQ